MVSRRTRFAVSWRRAGLGLRLLFIVLGVILFALVVYLRRPEEEATRAGSGILVFTLVNLNIVILCVLAFLIGRNVVKLIFDRRRGILGSQLRTRLVVAFVGLTLIPTIILFVLASGLLSRAMEGWFSNQVEVSVSGAVEVARQHHTWLKEYTKDVADSLKQRLINSHQWREFNQEEGNTTTSFNALREDLDKERKRWKVFSIRVFSPLPQRTIEVQNAAAVIENFSEPILNNDAFQAAQKGSEELLLEEKESSQFIRVYSPIKSPLTITGEETNNLPLYPVIVVSLRVTPELLQTLQVVNDSFRQYKQLKMYAAPLKSGYILTLTMITGLLLFSAIWIAFYIAREIAVPIQRLADATRSVAKGRYDVQIREVGGDELGLLVRSFNQMTNDIKQSRKESERRRVFIETILGNLAVGVIALDQEHAVTAVNAAAAQICGIDDVSHAIGLKLSQLLSPAVHEQITPVIQQLIVENSVEGVNAATVLEKEVTFHVQGRELKVVCTGGMLLDDSGRTQGYALLFDDVTELSKAQHMSAWREVAQRIAHEIKNPLTPIQLSAQRLQRLVGAEPEIAIGNDIDLNEHGLRTPETGSQREKILDCAQTIVEHVNSIKRLANEFSNFARMPHADFAETNLNELIAMTIEPFAESHANIVFQFIPDNTLPMVQSDREQVRRVLINLIDNAIAAIESTASQTSESPRITVRSFYDRRRRSVRFEVADNGPGISPTDKMRIFEPYFTTKKAGTGLGLAIVTTIVSDHQGEIRVYDNIPHGVKFVIELPLSPKKVTQRRFAV